MGLQYATVDKTRKRTEQAFDAADELIEKKNSKPQDPDAVIDSALSMIVSLWPASPRRARIAWRSPSIFSVSFFLLFLVMMPLVRADSPAVPATATPASAPAATPQPQADSTATPDLVLPDWFWVAMAMIVVAMFAAAAAGIWLGVRQGRQRVPSIPAMPVSSALHRCAVCGETDESNPALEFRVAANGLDYCRRHLPARPSVGK